jgi:hypothetical protein
MLWRAASMMRQHIKGLVVGVIILLGGVVSVDSSTLENAKSKTRIQLTISITSARYCYSDGKMLSLRLKLHYANVTSERIILYKDSAAILETKISRSLRDANARRYELNEQVIYKRSPQPELAEAVEPTADFIVIAPRSSYETETQVFVPLRTEDERIPNLAPGKHVLQLRIATWLWTETAAKRLSLKWSSFGRLWSDDITSLPTPLKIDKNPTFVECR